MKKIISILLTLAVIVGGVVAAWGFGSNWGEIKDFKDYYNGWGLNKPTDDKDNDKKPDNSDNEDNKNNDNSDDNYEIVNNGISLLCADLPVEAYAANGVSEQALEAYKLTVNRSPAASLVDDFQWVVEFVTPLPSWANNKTVTDYVTIAVADDNLSVVVECLQSFSARVQVTVSYVPDTTKSATCYFDYQQQIDTIELYLDEDNYIFNTPYWAEISVRINYTNGTIKCPHMPTDVIEAYYELSDEAYNAIINSDYYKTFLKLNRGVTPFNKSTVDYIKTSAVYSPDSVVYNCRVDSFCEYSTATVPLYIDGLDALAAAFIDAAETVKDFYRLVGTVVECNENTGNVMYTYGTAYSGWLELDTARISSEVFELDDLSFPENNHTFGQ